jgi:pilus assembly protein CpaE
VVLPGMDGYQLCRRLRQNPATRSLPILMVTGQSDLQDKVAGFESGVDDYVTKPFEPEELVYRVKGLLARAKARPLPPVVPEGRGHTIAFFGGKGGVGKTTLAVNLAVAIHRRAHKGVVLFDADFYFGDVGVHLGLPPERNVTELIKYIGDLTPELADQVLATHDSGVRVLLNPARPEEADLIAPAHVRRLLDVLADMHDYVIVDCQPSYDERMLVVLEQADDILLVITPEIGPIKNTSHFLNLAARMGLAQDKVHIILNRANSDVGIGVGEIERTLKHRVAYQIVSGGRPVVVSVNRGAPIVLSQGDHPLAQQVMRMADHMTKSVVRG